MATRKTSGQGGNWRRVNGFGCARDATKRMTITSTAISANKYTSKQGRMQIQMESNGSSANRARSGSTQIARSKMDSQTYMNFCRMKKIPDSNIFATLVETKKPLEAQIESKIKIHRHLRKLI
jgi:hypothetical protein